MIQSDRLGPIECNESMLLHFADGLLGFEHLSDFAVVAADDDGVYFWLQSADDSSVAFLTVVPGLFFPDYEPDVPDLDVEALDLSKPSDAHVLCIITIGEDAITANLLGPVIVNVSTRAARQVVLGEQRWSVHAPLGAVTSDGSLCSS